MARNQPLRARVSMIMNAPAEEIFQAFVDSDKLTRFWLSFSSASLKIGEPVHWTFMVPGAVTETIATKLEPGRAVAWTWSDGSAIEIALEEIDAATAVTVVVAGFSGADDEIVEAALNATEGFALVLADLKTLLESGRSANIVRDKARLMQLRA